MSTAEAETVIGLAIGVCTLVGIVVAYVKWLRPHYKDIMKQFVAIRDAIIGREAIKDSITDRVIEPKLLGIGHRQDQTERAVELLTVLVEKQGETLEQVTQFITNQSDLSILVREHSVELTDHEARIEKLEEAAVERVVSKAESVAAWRAIEEAVKATPDEVVEP